MKMEENGRISNFKGLVTLTLTFYRVTRHTVMHHSSTSTYIPNFIGIGKTFYGRMGVRKFRRGVTLEDKLLVDYLYVNKHRDPKAQHI